MLSEPVDIGRENENENTEVSGKVEIESEAKNENSELSPLCLKGCRRSSASPSFKPLSYKPDIKMVIHSCVFITFQIYEVIQLASCTSKVNKFVLCKAAAEMPPHSMQTYPR